MTDLDWDQIGAGAGALVWGHGLTSSRKGDQSSPLAGLLPAAAAAGWRCIRYDARGHGTSPAPPDAAQYRWDVLADDMAEVATAAGVGRFVAAGASMGAATALFAALAHPDRVTGLVLVIPPTAWETRAAQGAGYETMAGIAEAKGIDRLVALSRAQPPTTMFGDEGKARSLENLAAMDPGAFPHVMRGAAASDLPAPETLRSVHVPTLVLSWAHDAGHPVSTGERLAEEIPGAELHVADTPDAVAQWPTTLTEFLDRL